MTPQTIIESVVAEFGPESRDEFFRELYEICFPDVAAFIASRGGSLEDARDVFHDALIDLYEKSRGESLEIRVGIPQYLMGIVRNKWHRRFAKRRSEMDVEGVSLSHIHDDTDNTSPDGKRLLAMLHRAGNKCLQLLELFYYHGMKPRDVAIKNGYANEQVATVQKYKCLRKVRNFVKQKSLSYDDFME